MFRLYSPGLGDTLCLLWTRSWHVSLIEPMKRRSRFVALDGDFITLQLKNPLSRSDLLLLSALPISMESSDSRILSLNLQESKWAVRQTLADITSSEKWNLKLQTQLFWKMSSLGLGQTDTQVTMLATQLTNILSGRHLENKDVLGEIV